MSQNVCLEEEEVKWMGEEKRGHAKITLEIELNEALMEMMKEGMKNMPQMGGMVRRMMPRRSEENE